MAGATGAGSIELAFRSTDYRMRAEAATSLCLAIATATTTRIEVSLDADPDAEMLILLNGIHELTAANFSL